MPKSTKSDQADAALVRELARAISETTRSAKFCVDGGMPGADPGLEIAELGPVALPLKRGMGAKLVARCRVAPYGKGTETLVDTRVRRTFELDPEEFQLADAWNARIAEVVKTVAEGLGLPADRLEARLYKLLVYEKGGFFVPHRDSEKHDRMVASLIVVLPNPFEGGRLVVQHGSARRDLDFKEAAAGAEPQFAAFYADCEHEVKSVTRGVRLCLAYNLVLRAGRTRAKTKANARSEGPVDVLARSIGSWVAQHPAQPLVFALEHHYTERGLSLDLLKGADRRLAALVQSAAKQADCHVFLAQVSRHLSQYADDGSFGRSYSRYDDDDDDDDLDELTIGETYEDELEGTDWASLDGKKQPWTGIPLNLEAIIASTPIDEWTPTSQEYEGYTGNAGNTLDRWYHRSALVVWRQDQHFEVVASGGAVACIPLFHSMVARLPKSPVKKLDAAREDGIRLARAIIAQWPPRSLQSWRHAASEKTPYDDFVRDLPTLHDRETIRLFLAKLAEKDSTLEIGSLVVSACREFGWTAFADELRKLLTAPAERGWTNDLAPRNVEWLSAFCCDRSKDPEKAALASELCTLAADRFCKSKPERIDRRYQRGATIAESSLPSLLRALLAAGRDEDLARVLQVIEQSPDAFSLDHGQVPALLSLIPWSRKRFGKIPPRLAGWLASVRRRLEAATARRPQPPTDWARPAELSCNCEYCNQLRAFLADPSSEVGRIAAREDRRRHLTHIISDDRCDVKTREERKGSPYSLVLTKTTGSYERAVQRFEADCRLLESLPADS
ncbi:MAG: 2OG-Fe(II) oxygenase [Isosphaeraceae bacterium]